MQWLVTVKFCLIVKWLAQQTLGARKSA